MKLKHVCASPELCLAMVRHLSETAVNRSYPTPHVVAYRRPAVPEREVVVYQPWRMKWSGGEVVVPRQKRQESMFESLGFMGGHTVSRNGNRAAF